MQPVFCLRYKNGKFVGVDYNSGGYPYETDNPKQIEYFRTEEQAKDYVGHFKEYMEVCKIEFVITKI